MEADTVGDFQTLLNLGKFDEIKDVLVSSLLDVGIKFDKRLDTFKLRIHTLLYHGIETEANCNAVFEHLCSLQNILSPEVPLELDPDQIMLYAGPTYVGDPLLLSSVIVDFLWILEQELGFCTEEGDNYLQAQKRKLLVDISNKLINNFIPPILVRERLEIEFQNELGLVTDVKNARKREVRARTSLLYVQKKYNLIREECEGFSQLLVEIHVALERLNEFVYSRQSGASLRRAIEDAAENLLLRIISLIGYYSLDSNRVIDVILDVFIFNVSEHYEFFIYFLQICPWNVSRKGSPFQDTLPQNNTTNTTSSTNILNEVLATKFSGYDSGFPPKDDVYETYVVAALLVKHNMVSLEYLYTRLSPPDSEIDTLYDKYVDLMKRNEDSFARFQSQSISGQLGDQGISSTASISQNVTSTKKMVDPIYIRGMPCHLNQKASFVKACLELGSVKTAFSILNRLPKLSYMYSDIPELISRLLHEIVVFHDVNPISSHSTPQISCGCYDVVKTVSVKKTISSFISSSSAFKSKPLQYVYFYPEWNFDCQPTADSLKFATSCRVFLANIGPNLNRSPILLAKLIRIGAKHVAVAKERLESHTTCNAGDSDFFNVDHQQVLNSWLSILTSAILPAISRTNANPSNSYWLWQIIGSYPTKTRYALYGEWKHRIYDEYPHVSISRSSCLKDCRYIMTRLSKDLIKQSGRQIAKVVHSNPLITFSYIVRQIKAYDNMIPHILDATRYLTDLEFDIFIYCIIEAFASESMPRWENNFTTLSSWFKYLACFTGKLYRKHPTDLSGILLYIMSQLIKGNVYELFVLQELLSSMSGARPPDEITSSQLESLSGSETLKKEVFFYENTKALKKSSSRLSKALVETELISKIAIIISQLRQRLTSCDPGDEYENDLKTVVWLSDFCSKTLMQYVNFISNDISNSTYLSVFPKFSTLVKKYNLGLEYAFSMYRNVLSHPLYSLSISQEPTVVSGTEQNMQVDSNYPNECNIYDAVDSHETRIDCINTIMDVLPKSVWDCMSQDFYFNFWRLTIRDFYCPLALYNSEIKVQTKLKKTLDAEYAISTTGSNKFGKKMEKASLLVKTLENEKMSQEIHTKIVIEYLKTKSRFWFINSIGHNETTNAMIQYCIYPRLIISSIDAIYTAKFILLIHKLGVLNVPTISLFDKLLNGSIFHAIIFSSTEEEAKNYGIFLTYLFDTLSSWRKLPELFAQEAIGVNLPGFLKKWPMNRDPTHKVDFSNAEYILHDEFRQAMRKWHLKMFRVIIYCLRSKDYTRMRNSFFVLDRIMDHFPATKEMGKHLEQCVLEIESNETREDLKQLARSYYSKMQLKKHNWMKISDFRADTPQKQHNANEISTDKFKNPTENSDIPPPTKQGLETRQLDTHGPETRQGSETVWEKGLVCEEKVPITSSTINAPGKGISHRSHPEKSESHTDGGNSASKQPNYTDINPDVFIKNSDAQPHRRVYADDGSYSSPSIPYYSSRSAIKKYSSPRNNAQPLREQWEESSRISPIEHQKQNYEFPDHAYHKEAPNPNEVETKPEKSKQRHNYKMEGTGRYMLSDDGLKNAKKNVSGSKAFSEKQKDDRKDGDRKEDRKDANRKDSDKRDSHKQGISQNEGSNSAYGSGRKSAHHSGEKDSGVHSNRAIDNIPHRRKLSAELSGDVDTRTNESGRFFKQQGQRDNINTPQNIRWEAGNMDQSSRHSTNRSNNMNVSSSVFQCPVQRNLRIQEFSAIDITPHTQPGLQMEHNFIPRSAGGTWQKNDISMIKNVFRNKTIRITNPDTGPPIISSQQQQMLKNINFNRQQTPSDANSMQNQTGKQHWTNEHKNSYAKEPHSIENMKYGRKRKERDSTFISGEGVNTDENGQGNEPSEKKSSRRYQDTYKSSSNEDNMPSSSRENTKTLRSERGASRSF